MGVSLPVMRCLLVNRGPAIPLYMFNAHEELSCLCHFTVWYDEKYAYKFVFPKKIGTARVDIKTQGTDHRCDEHHAVALAVVTGVNYVLQRRVCKQCGLFMVVG